MTNLSGAVDLQDPVLLAIQEFKDRCAISKARAVVLIAQDSKGSVFAAARVPGGQVEQAGMLYVGGMLLHSGLQAQILGGTSGASPEPSK